MKALLLCLVLLAGACSSNSAEPEPTVGAWASENADAVARSAPILDDITFAAELGDTDGLIDACSDLGDWAEDLQDAEAIPDPAIDSPWQDALDEAALASTTCVGGARADDADLIYEASDHIAAFGDDIAEVSAALDAHLP